MATDLTTRILNDPNYQALKARRTRFGWTLTLAMMVERPGDCRRLHVGRVVSGHLGCGDGRWL